jgi:hypothetical protein
MARVNGLEIPGLDTEQAARALGIMWDAMFRGPTCHRCKKQIRSPALARAEVMPDGSRFAVCVDCYEAKK